MEGRNLKSCRKEGIPKPVDTTVTKHLRWVIGFIYKQQKFLSILEVIKFKTELPPAGCVWLPGWFQWGPTLCPQIIEAIEGSSKGTLLISCSPLMSHGIHELGHSSHDPITSPTYSDHNY